MSGMILVSLAQCLGTFLSWSSSLLEAWLATTVKVSGGSSATYKPCKMTVTLCYVAEVSNQQQQH